MGITFCDVRFSYPQKPIFENLNLSVPDNGVTCLFGPSGCGKTTLLRLMLGLETPQSGSITRTLSRPSVVFQEDRLLPWKTALENAAFPLTAADAIPRAADALRKMDLSDEVFHRYPHELSGGMQRRVAIARALAAQSDWLALDEPFSGIDAATQEKIAIHIRNYAQTHPVVLVTHHPEEIALLQASIIEL